MEMTAVWKGTAVSHISQKQRDLVGRSLHPLVWEP